MDLDVYVRYYYLPFYIKKTITVCNNFLMLNNYHYNMCNILKINEYLFQIHFKNITFRFVTNLNLQLTLRKLNPTAIERKLSCML